MPPFRPESVTFALADASFKKQVRGDTKMCANQFLRWGFLFVLAATAALAQEPAGPPPPDRSAGPGPRMWEGNGQPLFGKITAIHNGTLELAKPDGSSVAVKISEKTEFRKDRQNAKLADFKAGDMVFIRAEGSVEQGFTALMVATRTGGPGGPGMSGSGGGLMMMNGELGKDFVFGEVKSVDAPKITVLRPDGVTQTLELNEETSLRKGRESVTMAEIQPGEHVLIRGAVQNNAFVPKMVMVIGAEQWKRMQEMGMTSGGAKPPGDSKPTPPQP